MTSDTGADPSTGSSRRYRDVLLSALGPLSAFLIALARVMSGQGVLIQAATPLLFAAVLLGAAFAGKWSALSTTAIASFGLLLGARDEDLGTTLITVGALIAAALVTGELRDRAERSERSAEIANARLKRVSLRDGVTGLLDRRGFELAIGIEIARAIRRRGTLAVLLVHLDGMSAAGERFGRSVADTLVQVLADAVERRIRQSDVSARVADDEIAIILPDTDAPGAALIAAHVIARFREDLRGAVPASLAAQADYGVAMYPADGREMDALLASAGRARRGELSGAVRP